MLSKIRNASSVRNSSATRIAGFISGIVMRKKRCTVLAPSTLAASCSSSGTSASPASSSSAMNGVVFQTSARMITSSDPAWVLSGCAVSEISGRPATNPLVGSKAYFQANAATTVMIP